MPQKSKYVLQKYRANYADNRVVVDVEFNDTLPLFLVR